MANPDFDSALEAVSRRLSEGATAHCVRVAQTAAMLAEQYGADVEAASLGGLLHDWDREQGSDRLLASSTEAGLPLNDIDRQVPYLLHARTGALDLADAFPGISPAVLSAVRNHTVGSPDMSDVDKIVYLADMLEPARDYPGIDELRDAIGGLPLDELFAFGYQHSVAFLIERRRWIHPDTVDVWNALVAGGVR